jgi:hypothetical protein
MPQQWKDYYNNYCEGNIPDIPQTTLSPGGPRYPTGYDPTSFQVCSATYKACRMEGDIWDAPYGYMALGFDDGPWLVSGYSSKEIRHETGLGHWQLYNF